MSGRTTQTASRSAGAVRAYRSKLRAASRRVEWTVPRAQECPSCAACCRHTAGRWVLCMPSDRCVLVCHVRRDPTFSMAARKKVLLKVIILGDSGYVDSAVRGCTKLSDSRHLCCSGACKHGGAGAVAEHSRIPASAQHARAMCHVNASSFPLSESGGAAVGSGRGATVLHHQTHPIFGHGTPQCRGSGVHRETGFHPELFVHVLACFTIGPQQKLHDRLHGDVIHRCWLR